MSSPDAALEDEPAIAEQLAQEQRAISIAEFFEKNKHMLGFDSEGRALVTAVKEGVDNAIDAAEDADILPDIYVNIEEKGDYYRVVIEDNGPGITKEQIPKVFGKLLYGSRFHKREQSLPGDQRVLVKHNGIVTVISIGTLCDAVLPAEGSATVPLAADIEVPAFNRDTGEVTWQPVTHAIRHETDTAVYEVRTEDHRSVRVTGNHSLFGIGSGGELSEVDVNDLAVGDAILAPSRLPRPDIKARVNLLAELSRPAIEDREMAVSGLDRADQEALVMATRGGQREFGSAAQVEVGDRRISAARLEAMDLEDDWIPAAVIKELGWEERVADGEIQFAGGDGEVHRCPVSLPIEQGLLTEMATTLRDLEQSEPQSISERPPTELVDAPILEDHGGPAQGQQEHVTSATGPSDTVAEAAAMLLETVPEESDAAVSIPSLVFHAPPPAQRAFLRTLCTAPEADTNVDDPLSYSTTSSPLARQLRTLAAFLGIQCEAAESAPADAAGSDSIQLTMPHSELTGGEVNSTDATIPTALLNDLRVATVDRSSVPATIPGVFLGVGIGDDIDDASDCAQLAVGAMTGDLPPDSPTGERFQDLGLLTPTGDPTETLDRIWELGTRVRDFCEDGLSAMRVSAIERTDAPEYVYDISVPGATGRDENFLVANDGPLFVKNSRGQQGIGISAAVLYAQLTSGKPAKITSRTAGSTEAEYFEIVIDTDDNEPEIRTEKTTTWDRPQGTRLELDLAANMRARKQLHQYIKQTAVVNPHARLELHEPNADLKFERGTDALPADTEEIRPHPHGVELGSVLKMLQATDSHSLSGFLQSEFTRVGRKTADEIIAGFKDRYFGREAAWQPPDDEAIRDAVIDATANKGRDATRRFGTMIADTVYDQDHVAYCDVEQAVASAAETVEDEFGTTFGGTVRENATEAAWSVITAELVPDLRGLVDAATSNRKSDAVIDGLATRLAEQFAALENPRHRLTRGELVDQVDRAAEMTIEHQDASIGETARENITAALWDRMPTVPDDVPRVSALADDRDAANDLIGAMRAASIMAPPTDCLSPITSELIRSGLEKEYNADFYTAATREGKVHAGDPFIVEAGIAYGGELDEESGAEVLRFANRVPLVYQRGACATTDVVRSIGWRNYGLNQPGGSGVPQGPAVIMIHVASTNVPFTSESKDAIANVPEIEDEIELAVRECARDLRSYLNRRESLKQRREKANVLTRILPQMATKVAAVTERDPPNIDDALARIMNNVLVDTVQDGDTRRLRVRNHSDQNESFEITEIIDSEPTNVSDDLDVVEMDGQWYLMWEVEAESQAELTADYSVADVPDSEIVIDGIDEELVTVTQEA